LVTIFVASPSELEAERWAVHQAARTVNLAFSKETGIYFEVVGWEDVPSNLGADPQEVINQYFEEDQYDVLIGIMADRLGKPTRRASSGTVEEYQRALARYADDPDSVHVQFFFKRNPGSPGNADYEALQEFKQQVYDRVLCREFDDVAELERLLVSNIAQTARTIGRKRVAESR
jgi:hypothetical protein